MSSHKNRQRTLSFHTHHAPHIQKMRGLGALERGPKEQRQRNDILSQERVATALNIETLRQVYGLSFFHNQRK